MELKSVHSESFAGRMHLIFRHGLSRVSGNLTGAKVETEPSCHLIVSDQVSRIVGRHILADKIDKIAVWIELFVLRFASPSTSSSMFGL